MKYYVAELKERNGEYEYQHIYKFKTQVTPAEVLHDIAKDFYDYETGHKEEDVREGLYYFNEGEVCVQTGGFCEIEENVFNSLPYFIPEYYPQ